MGKNVAIIQQFHTVIWQLTQRTNTPIASLVIVELDCVQFDHIHLAGPGGTTERIQTLALHLTLCHPSNDIERFLTKFGSISYVTEQFKFIITGHPSNKYNKRNTMC